MYALGLQLGCEGFRVAVWGSCFARAWGLSVGGCGGAFRRRVSGLTSSTGVMLGALN